MPSSFPVALCADDYAFSPAVSAGIREALAAGRLTATGAMTNQPFWGLEAKALAPVRGRAEIGVHLTLTVGAPLGAMPRFAPQGALPSLAQVIKPAWAGRLPLDEIRAEIDRQLDAFEAGVGEPPAFVDGHQHVHALPGVREALLDAMAARGWAGKVWTRDSADRLVRVARRGEQARKALVVAALTAGFGRAARRRGFAVNDGFSGFSAFDPKASYADAFSRYLRAPGRAHLVMCHPGHVDEALRRLDPVLEPRENELAFLLSDAFAPALERAGARLRPLGRTLADGSQG
jgi:hypothetical protein